MPTRRVLRRSLIGAVVVLAVLLVVALATGVALVRRPFPATEGQVLLPGLGAEVSVQRDARGVPQIYADSTDDLFRAQGYVHAQDRFFEMDWRRHYTAGRLSELMGEDDGALASDRLARTLGWRKVAQAELEQVAPDTRRHLDAYARGVNDYLRGRSAAELSVSYPLLGLGHPMPMIEPWTPVDSLSWFKAVAWDLRGDYDSEVDRALAFGVVRDVKRVDQLYPAYPYARNAPVLPDGGESGGAGTPVRSTPAASGPVVSGPVKSVPVKSGAAGSGAAGREPGRVVPADQIGPVLAGDAQQVLARAGAALSDVPTGAAGGDGIGSNSWVVSGRLTSTGKPMLADDPHLAPALPGAWYQVGLHCRTVGTACPFDVAGFSYAGVPGVYIGHNAQISWGVTGLGSDVTDLYLEKVTGDQVERDGAQVPLTRRTEVIAVAGAPDVTITVRTGPHGPLLSDAVADTAAVGQRTPPGRAAPARGQGYAVALAWTALSPGRDMDAVFAIDAAQDFDAFRKGAQLMSAPALGLVYADVDGHIGYQAAGRTPLRAGGAAPDDGRPDTVPTDGTWPLAGWTSGADWKGYVPAADLPWTADPAQGFVVAANQAVTPPNGRVTLAQEFDYGYRAQRIRDLLTAPGRRGAKLTVADQEAIQRDTFNSTAAQLVPLLEAAKINDRFYTEAVALLKDWNGDQSADSAAAAYFNAVWASLLELTFSDELPKGSPLTGGGRWFEVVRNLLDEPNDAWWDDRRSPSVLETRDEIIRQSIIQARNRLTRMLGKDPDTWSWGRLHRLELKQTPLGSDDSFFLHSLLTHGPVELPGGSVSVNALGWDASGKDFEVTSAPSMRMVVDLSDLDASRWVNQTGQSGHPGNGHYTDQLHAWARGHSYTWSFSNDAVRSATEETLTLRPASG